MNIKLLTTIIIALLGVLFVEAQVTIGSNVAPREGVLIDLKENDKLATEANAKAGLGIPRVELVSPDRLTIDQETKKSEYLGATVYNVVENEILKKGPYTWNGDEWIRVLTSIPIGNSGQILYSTEDGTTYWDGATEPKYPFYMPTTVSFFDASKMMANDYSYSELTAGGTIDRVSTVNIGDGAEKRYAYIDQFYTKINDGQDLHFKLFFTYEFDMKTKELDADLLGVVWLEYKVNVYIDDQLVVGDKISKLLRCELLLDPNYYANFATMIKLPPMDDGAHSLKIEIIPLRHTFSTNVGTSGGHFEVAETSLLEIKVVEYLLMAFEKEK